MSSRDRNHRQQDSSENAIIHQASFSGPLPPPNMLEQYNKIIPNCAERILTMAENQSKHRQELEKKVIFSDSRNSLLGIISALTLGLATILGGCYVILKGYAFHGTFLGSAGLVGLVYVFIYGTSQRRKERELKAKGK